MLLNIHYAGKIKDKGPKAHYIITMMVRNIFLLCRASKNVSNGPWNSSKWPKDLKRILIDSEKKDRFK